MTLVVRKVVEVVVMGLVVVAGLASFVSMSKVLAEKVGTAYVAKPSVEM